MTLGELLIWPVFGVVGAGINWFADYLGYPTWKLIRDGFLFATLVPMALWYLAVPTIPLIVKFIGMLWSIQLW